MQESRESPEVMINPDAEMSNDELDKIDGGTGGGEQTSMRLQQYMEKRSKAFETLSNLMHKKSGIGDSITQNQK